MISLEVVKKWVYSVFIVLLFLGVGQSIALEKQAIGTELVNSWKVLDDAGIKINSIDDVKYVDDYLKKNPKAKVADEIADAGGFGKWKSVANGVVKNVDEVKHLLKTESNTAFFWSGRTSKGIGVEAQAAQIAKSRNGTTLETLLKEKNINMPAWDASNPAVVKIWEDASGSYANQVSGEVKAVIGKNLRQGNVWENIELPRLKSNLNVTKIITIDPETMIETIIFTR